MEEQFSKDVVGSYRSFICAWNCVMPSGMSKKICRVYSLEDLVLPLGDAESTEADNEVLVELMQHNVI